MTSCRQVWASTPHKGCQEKFRVHWDVGGQKLGYKHKEGWGELAQQVAEALLWVSSLKISTFFEKFQIIPNL